MVLVWSGGNHAFFAEIDYAELKNYPEYNRSDSTLYEREKIKL